MSIGMDIAGRKVGIEHKPLVIAEIGINHEGSLAVAKAMVDAAAGAGAEVIKHQTHVVDDEMSGQARTIIPGNADISIYEIMERCALDEIDEMELKDYVESKGLIFISTPFSRAAADRLERMGVVAYKIGSGECNNYPLLEYIASFGKPIILSTGMNDIESVSKAVAIFRKQCVSYALLHCTNIYPTPPELVRLGAIEELQQAFPDAVVGLSDHSISNYPCLGAVALGASILERHFTDSMTRPGPDICCSMDPQALTELIRGSEVLFKARGGRKTLLDEEQVTRDFANASVVTIRSVKKGEVLSKDNLWVKRPGTGEFSAECFASLLGHKASRDIAEDKQLSVSDVDGWEK
ncbi:N-acetylneuraminate synthase family protein [Motiliproteus sp. MSK22-1]|uniref:N-acetylneuraminate synthase family protein n=1 Tax=Motiliproteus sp. MSK22-1 TaxID=1897630 RepID=UPI0009771E1A|nr:N-acetylneuraminate synthase family protein [Motiliproteus sp. MSK22-1]OMH30017.1 polyhydroxyalkanoate biosynthesis repressor PhaR [Motiliproteus sp. MSK22-1]